MKSALAAVGFRVKSGWATAILLAGPADSPRVLERRAIDLCDPAVPGSAQPYHAVMGATAGEAPTVEEHLCKVVNDATLRSVGDFLRDCHQAGHDVRGAGVVVGSVIDPATVRNDHIRAHALEGRLFRTALEGALRASGLSCSVLVERSAYANAAAVLGHSETDLKRLVADLGRPVAGPWRADEKTATLAAWLALKTGLPS
jgi:hypothetical protein